ncbi:dicarboxylate/amino acid:cation symporter [Gammaproteobacteria bacterium]|nr:dicarboxylate/amino acid:cation symporter [Gammaproteobacteria bacterium]
MIDAPTNLTRNILIGMFAGFVVGAIFYYTNLFGDQISSFVEKYVFLLGSTIFINLLKMLIVPLIFLQ